MKKRIDINCDMGESFGRYLIGNDEAIMPYISSCNIACGFHAGDPLVISKTINQALSYDINIGAHPSYPDLQGFGRRSMSISSDELTAMMIYQIGAVKYMTEASGGKLKHVKPHGALYNDMSTNEDLSTAFINAIVKIDPELTIFGLPDSETERLCRDHRLTFKSEFFADRNYQNNGQLVSRVQKNAILNDPDQIAERVLHFMKDSTVFSITGNKIDLNAETICIHGDHPNAVAIARKINTVLREKHVTIAGS